MEHDGREKRIRHDIYLRKTIPTSTMKGGREVRKPKSN